ncbi:polysaccharide biosynthesis protein [Prevotella sp. CAG:1058]|nr:polysaccharide biosynthesis protein [Prevotella sp. CAG:1058]
MSEQLTSNKTIAKNTIFLYFRMMFTMAISLYTSRVILQKLGVQDYGIYQAVGGIVGFLSFINGALSTGSSRFLTFALGEGDKKKLRRTFSTTLIVHIVLAVFIAIVAELGGLWFIEHKMVIPSDRIDAAVFTFHLSIVTALLTLTQVPYNACIIAHERMSIFAYISIVEVSLKLIIVYLLTIWSFDRLMLYASLLFVVQAGLMVFYRYYCSRNFVESRFKLIFDRSIFKEIASFSGWSLFSNASIALNSQGILLLLNMFFSPAVVAARAISIQVNMAANQFVSNFRTAVNPQIVKKYASKDYEGSKHLLLSSTKYSYYLMLILALPIYFSADQLLHIWLGVVPEYTTIFLQIIIIQSLFQVFDTSFYTALYAKGQLRENAILSPLFGFISFPIVYFLFKAGFSPVTLSLANLVSYAILGVIVKPILVINIVNYNRSDIFNVFFICAKVSIIAIIIPLIVYFKIENITTNMWIQFILLVIISVSSVIMSIWTFGLDSETKIKVLSLIKKKIYIHI